MSDEHFRRSEDEEVDDDNLTDDSARISQTTDSMEDSDSETDW